MERSEIIEKLEEYYNHEGIIPPPGQFACKNQNRCRSRSNLARGMQCHIGEKYGTKMKVLVASMDCGYGGADNISKRTANVIEVAEKGPFNPHMRGTYQALALFYDEKEPRDLVHYMAMTNTCKCCRKDSPNHMTIGFYKRCREHSLKEIQLLEPDVILFQGEYAPVVFKDYLSPIDGVSGLEIKPYVKKFKYEGVECFAVLCIHPSARDKRVSTFYRGILPQIADYIKKQLKHSLDWQKVARLFRSFATMVTHYFKDPEEALKRAKAAGKQPGCWWCGITLPSGKKGWAIYKGGKVVEKYAVM